MRISYNWLRAYIGLEKTPEEVSAILTDIGLEVEHVERIFAVPGNLEGLVVGEVLSCVQHPNADRLKQTTVDVGAEEPLSIVCGAPNVAAGQKVIVALVGAELHPSAGEPFSIKKSKIRGVVSEGMICAEDEIGLGAEHAGIMVLDPEAKVGQKAASYFNLEETVVFEIGLTPNRSDAISHYGVARDLAAYLRIKPVLPEFWGDADLSTATSPIQVEVADTDLCPRYTSVVMRNVRVDDSPKWLADHLRSIGLRPVNNIVDITNFVMHELGQPLHAFDAEKIASKQIRVQAGMQGSFVTLDQVERTLDPADLMIADASGALCMAGVMGGLNSGVSTQTTQVFLESAYFNPVSVRQTSKRHALKSDSSFRFERGTDPNFTEVALRRAMWLIREIAGGELASEISDIYPVKQLPIQVDVSVSRVQEVIGKQIPQAEMQEILEALEIEVLATEEGKMLVEIPTYRSDVTREIDVIEEILRIYGYNNIEFSTQIKSSLHIGEKPDPENTQHTIADLLVARGFYEIMNNSLSKADFLEEPDRAVQVLNPLSGDLAVLRQNLLFSALETLSYNQKRNQKRIALFEFGKVYFKATDTYQEGRKLSLLMSGSTSNPHWAEKTRSGTFYDLKGVIEFIMARLGISDYKTQEADASYLQYGLSLVYRNRILATFGEVEASYKVLGDVEGEVFYGELDWDAILKSIQKQAVVYQEVSKYPAVKRDLSLLVDANLGFDQLKKIALASDKKILRSVDIFDVYKGKHLPEGKKSYALSFIFQDSDKTLKDKQVDALVQKLIANFEREVGAEVRK